MQRFDDWLRQWARGPWQRVVAGLVVICLVLFLTGFAALPPVDRDEASFAQSSRQMYATGDLIDIRLHDAARYKKPVGIYWLQTAAVTMTGGRGEGSIVTYRMVSLLAAIGAVLMTWRIGALLAGAEAGVVAAVLLAATFLLGAEARLAKTDATMLLTVLVAEYVLARLWTAGDVAPRRWLVLSFWAALGAAVIVKGPIGPMIIALTLVALIIVRRSGVWARPILSWPGLAIFAAMVLPWYVAISLRTGGDFWAEALGRDLIGKVAVAQERHGAPPGSYLVAMWLSFWPATLPLVLGLPALWTTIRQQAALRFLLCWLVPGWVVFELVATKLLHYVLPVYPALAILAAIGLLRTQGLLAGHWRKAVAAVFLALPVIALGTLSAAAMRYGSSLPLPAIAGITATVVFGVFIWRALRDECRHAAVAGLVGLGLSLSAGFYLTLAGVTSIWPSAAVARVRDAFTACPAPVTIVAGYREPSVIFALGTGVRLVDGTTAARLMAGSSCGLAFITPKERPAFDAERTRLPLSLRDIGQITGTNIGSGAQVHLDIFARIAG